MAAFKSPYQAADLGTVMRLMRRTLRFALLAAAVAVPLRSDDASILVQEEAKEDEAGLALLAFNEEMRAHDKQSERMFLEQNENKALSKLSNDLEVAMKALYVHIDNKEDDTLFEQLASMKRNENQVSAIPWRKNTGQRFEMEKGLAEKINALNISNASEKTELILKTSAYFKKLSDLNISDNVVTKNSPNIFLGWIVAVLGFPIYTAGILLNIFQFQLAKHIADKKIKQKIFQNSIRFGVLLFSNMMVGLLIVIIASSIHWLLAVISPLLLMLLAFYTINYHEFVQSWLEKMQFNGINKSDREVCKTMRMEILKSI